METDPVSKMLCSLCFLEYKMVDEVQKPSNPSCFTSDFLFKNLGWRQIFSPTTMVMMTLLLPYYSCDWNDNEIRVFHADTYSL
jgi:hypothetical protein